MLKVRREVKIGSIVLVGIVLLVFGINYLKGLDLLQSRNVYYALYTNTQGLSQTNPLLLNGYKVGQVLKGELLHDGTGRVLIAYQISEKDLNIPRDSRIEISGDFFTKWGQLIMGTAPPPYAHPGDTLVGNTQMNLTESLTSQIDPLKRKAEGMLASVDSVLTSVQSILNPKSRGDIDASFASIRTTLETFDNTAKQLDELLAQESGTIRSTMHNINSITANLAANNAALGHIFSNLDTLTASLSNGRLEDALANVNNATNELKGALEKINGGEGTLGKLVKDDSLYTNLNSASRELSILLEDLHTNPNRYLSIFGKKDKLPKLSEADIQRIREAEKAHP